MLSASRQIATRRLGSFPCFSGSDCVEAFLCKDSASLDLILASKFLWCEAQSNSVVVCTAGFRVHPEREDVMDTTLFKCKREMQAAFDRHTPALTRSPSLGPDSLQCLQKKCVARLLKKQVLVPSAGQTLQKSENLSSLLRWGCREHFVSGCWHSFGRDRGRYRPGSAGYLLWECCILASL